MDQYPPDDLEHFGELVAEQILEMRKKLDALEALVARQEKLLHLLAAPRRTELTFDEKGRPMGAVTEIDTTAVH